MRNIGSKDIYEVRTIGYFGASDLKPLIDFYLPLIGARAFSVYLALTEDPSIKDKTLVLEHESLFAKLQMSPGEFSSSLSPLEAVGLIRTFRKSSESGCLYSYCIYSPKSPKDFIDDILLSSSLKHYIGEHNFEDLIKKYGMSNTPEDLEDVSISFGEFFVPETLSQKNKNKNVKGRNVAEIKVDFDLSKFRSSFSSCGGSIDLLSEKEIEQIAKLTTLFSIASEVAGEMAFSRFSPIMAKGRRIDIKSLQSDFEKSVGISYLGKTASKKSEIAGDSDIAMKVRLFDSYGPAKYLSLLQEGRAVASSDLKIIKFLSLDIGLPDPVINVLVDYILGKNKNILSRPYAEKIGAALKREHIETAIDAMNYLHDFNKGRTFKKSNKSESKSVENKSTEVSDEELDKLLDSLDNL